MISLCGTKWICHFHASFLFLTWKVCSNILEVSFRSCNFTFKFLPAPTMLLFILTRNTNAANTSLYHRIKNEKKKERILDVWEYRIVLIMCLFFLMLLLWYNACSWCYWEQKENSYSFLVYIFLHCQFPTEFPFLDCTALGALD